MMTSIQAMQTITKENLLKNTIVLVLLLPFSLAIQASTEKSVAGDMLVAVSIIAVIACFGAFAFTYEKTSMQKLSHKLLAHFTTGLLLFVIGASLLYTRAYATVLVGPYALFDLLIVILYAACACFDMWDSLRTQKTESL